MSAEFPVESTFENHEDSPPLAGFLERLYLPLVVALLSIWTWRPLTGSEDFWIHIATGRWIWQNQSVPRETLWLWSTPPQAWVAHSWLSEIVLFAWMRLGGVHLVLLATIVLVALPFVWFWKLWTRRGRISALTPVFFTFAIWCASARLQPRPELFSYFFLSLLLLFLIEWPRSATRRNILAIVALFALWSNFHGAVALGILIIALTAGCELLQEKFSRASWKLAATAAAGALAVAFNPYGFAYWAALRQVGGAMFQKIDEWKPPLTQPGLPFLAVMLVLAIAAVALAGWAKNPQRRWSQLLWLAVGVLFFLTARRNIWPCILISLAVCAANAAGLNAYRPFALAPALRVYARGLAVAFVIGFILLALSPEAVSRRNGVLQLRATSRVLPEAVADTVLNRRFPGPYFNDYLRSGYFHWRFAGNPPIFIDLQNVYPPALLAEYFDIIKRTPPGVRAFEARKINTVIFGKYKTTDRLAPLAKYLNQSPQWQHVYRGEDGSIWTRRTPIAPDIKMLPAR